MSLDRAPRCSTASRLAGEPLQGTAPLTHFWLLVGDPHPPGNKAVKESNLPQEAKQYLNETAASITDCRLVLIRQPGVVATIPVFAAVSAGANSRLYEFHLNSYAELFDIDFVRLSVDPEPFSTWLSTQPFFLVCTNGRRDPCCSDLGTPFYLSLHSRLPERVFMSSHLGGHRFAPTVVHLPYGLYYGRFDPQSAGRLAERASTGNLIVENLRGRAEYPPPAQAAEIYLRQQSGVDAIHGYHLKELEHTINDKWTAIFRSSPGGELISVEVAQEPSTTATIESCAKPEERTVRSFFRLVQIKGT